MEKVIKKQKIGVKKKREIMNDNKDNFIIRLNNFIHKDTAISHFLLCLLYLFRGSACQVLIGILGTIVIAILIGKSYYGFWFYVSCIIYGLLISISASVNSFDNKVIKELRTAETEKNQKLIEKEFMIKYHERCACGIKTVASVNANHILKLSKRIQRKGSKVKLADARNLFGFQNAAFTVCKELYDIISHMYDTENQYITIFQRFKNASNETCKMIAYWNKNTEEPITYQNPYEIPDHIAENEKIEFHTQIFASNNISTRVLINQEEIQKKFKIHEQNNERENKIQQYVAVPIALSNEHIAILIQIDSEEQLFGNNVENAIKIAETLINPFARFLHFAYEVDRLMEILHNKYINK